MDQTDQTSYTFRRAAGVKFDELRSITDKFGAIDKKKAEDIGFERRPATPGWNRRPTS